jgi:hypothetical protein
MAGGEDAVSGGATMTEEQAEALRVYRRQVGTFHTPLGCDDGVLTRSFAYNADYIYESALRNADKVVTLIAYRHPDPPEDKRSWFLTKPIPKVGTRVGELYSGPLDHAPLPGPDLNEA